MSKIAGITKDKVELKAEKVELSVIDDLKKKLDSLTGKFDSIHDEVKKGAFKFSDIAEDFKKLNSDSESIKKKIKDIGLDEPKNLGFITLKSKELEKLSNQFAKSILR